MYSLSYHKFGTGSLICLKDEQSGSFIQVNPAMGGSLHQIALCPAAQLNVPPNIGAYEGEQRAFCLLDTYGSEGELQSTYEQTYKGARLSPFAGIVGGGGYTFLGKDYQLPINWPQDGHAIHGFFGKREFLSTTGEMPTWASEIQLDYRYAGDYVGFPFPCTLQTSYTLEAADTFSCETRVINTGSTAMPYYEGWHPYFQLSGEPGAYIQLPACQKLLAGPDLVPTGKKEPAQARPLKLKLAHASHDDTYELELSSSGSTGSTTRLYLPSARKIIHLRLQTGQAGYNFIHIYTPPDGKSVAMEPLSAAPNAYHLDKMPTIQVGEMVRARFDINLSCYEAE